MLKATGAGTAKAGAIKSLKEVIALLFEEAYEDGALDGTLSEAGLRRTKQAGLVVWKASRASVRRSASLDAIAFVATLHPRVARGAPAPEPASPVVIAAVA